MLLIRRKSVFLKALIILPTSWFLITLLINYNDHSTKLSVLQQDPQSNFLQNNNINFQPASVKDLQYDYVNRIEAQSPDNKQFAHIHNHNQINVKKKIDDIANDKKEEEAVIPMPLVKSGPGELGKPVVLPSNLSKEEERLVSKGWQDNSFNQYVSDMISVNRSLPEVRDPACKNLQYSSNLPPASVIICFHGEAWSVLLRTVHSVLNRSPPHLIHEIILVDDFSDLTTKPHLGKPLEDYVKALGKVKIVRAKKREGLIRARLLGFDAATGTVLLYLDSHCEAADGWLEPLLDRIAHNPTAVVCPVIDFIDGKTLEYHYSTSINSVYLGGFVWNLLFSWHAIPDRVMKTLKHSTDAVPSPTMAGGLFAISKEFFDRIGTYDKEFDIWGGENLELSFKSWMCGGTLEIMPCSHVGHIFRSRSPYTWRTGVNVLKRNSIRLAEVWLDEYKNYYYQRIGPNKGEYGDISEREELRHRLNCKSFEWYVKNVYPELFIPGEAVASGEIRNLAESSAVQMCLDSPARKKDYHQPIGLFPCHNQGGNQYFLLSKDGEIRRDEACLDYAGKDVVLYPCHGAKGNQLWIYEDKTGHIKHGSSLKCMEMSPSRDKVLMRTCKNILLQRWRFDNYNASKAVSLV